jgi:hypothetical protein
VELKSLPHKIPYSAEFQKVTSVDTPLLSCWDEKCLKNLEKNPLENSQKQKQFRKKGSKIVLEKCFKMNADFEVYSFILFLKLPLFLAIFKGIF